jgi:hypothetical protein
MSKVHKEETICPKFQAVEEYMLSATYLFQSVAKE